MNPEEYIDYLYRQVEPTSNVLEAQVRVLWSTLSSAYDSLSDGNPDEAYKLMEKTLLAFPEFYGDQLLRIKADDCCAQKS